MYYGNEDAESESNISPFITEEPYLLWEKTPVHRSLEGMSGYSIKDLKIAIDSQHNIIFAGTNNYYGGYTRSSCEYFVGKCDPDGNLIDGWPKRYRATGGDDGHFLTDVTVDKDDNIIVTGYSDNNYDAENLPGGLNETTGMAEGEGTYGFGAGEVYSGYDFWTIKISSDGTKIWDARYPTDIENGRQITKINDKYLFTTLSQYYAYAVASDSNGNLVVVGKNHSYGDNICGSPGTNETMIIVMYSQEGEMLWEKEIEKSNFISGDSDNQETIPTSVLFDSNDDIIIAGQWLKKSRLFWDNYDGFVMKLSSGGDNTNPAVINWIKTFESDITPDVYYDGCGTIEIIPDYFGNPVPDGDYNPIIDSDDIVYEIALDSEGNIVANTNFGVFKINPNGNLLVQKNEENKEEYDPNFIEDYCRDADGDGFCAYPCGNDCDDNNYYVHPGAEDIWDGIDNNCNRIIDLDHSWGWVGDTDGDTTWIDTSYLLSNPDIMPNSPVPITNPEPYDPDDNDPEGETPCVFFAPYVTMANDEYKNNIGETTNFEANITYVGVEGYDGEELLYKWNFGDGTTLTDSFIMTGGGYTRADSCPIIQQLINPDHIYASEGLYVATLDILEDGQYEYGRYDDAGSFVKIIDPCKSYDPVADACGPYEAPVRTLVDFDATLRLHLLEEGGTFEGSYDLDGEIISYNWDFGDGTTSTGAKPSHSYSQEGTYAVTLTVTDDDGLTGNNTTEVTCCIIAS